MRAVGNSAICEKQPPVTFLQRATARSGVEKGRPKTEDKRLYWVS
jgi:hypothetical protein